MHAGFLCLPCRSLADRGNLAHAKLTAIMNGWRRFRLLLLVGCCMAATSERSNPFATKVNQPNIIFITLDTTRADRMGFLGSTRDLTPNLDALAKHSVVFTRAYAQVPLTTPSHAAMLTGTYPRFSHILDLGTPLRSDLPYVPDLLHQAGYHTGAFVGSYILDPSGTAAGFGRGFDAYSANFHPRKPGEDRYKSVERRAEAVADRALAWISRHQQGPFFVWMHFYDAHDPYDPPSPFKEKFATAPYDGEIAYTDSVVGSFIEILQKHGLYQNTLIAIAADHGEAFGEHGEERHGMFLYDETIHVPLLMKLPGGKHPGLRVTCRVALADIAPSLLEAASVAVPKEMQGKSLLPLMAESKTAANQAKKADRAIYSETDYAHRSFGWGELKSWRTGKYLYVQAPKRELYDVDADPNALRNLNGSSKAVADTLDAQLVQFRRETASEEGERAKMDPARADKLRALGYLASDSDTSGDKPGPAIDPKDKIEIANQLHRALMSIEEEHYDEAIAQLQSVIRQEPDAAAGYLELGRALVYEKRYEEAVPVLRTAVQRTPKSGMAHYEFGLALIKIGQWEAAIPEMQAAVLCSPQSAQMHFYLGAANLHLKHVPEAAAEFDKALELDADDYMTNLKYGELLVLEGKADAAILKLSRAVTTEPKSAEAHIFLARAYDALGQSQNADQERKKAADLKNQPQPE